MTKEFRRAPRRKVNETIDVVDVMTHDVIGHLGNVSENGLLLVARHPLNDDALYQLKFVLPMGDGHPLECEVGAHQLWQEDLGGTGACWVGMRFIAIPDEQAIRLRQWTSAPGGTPA